MLNSNLIVTGFDQSDGRLTIGPEPYFSGFFWQIS